MTDQITVPRATWDAMRGALEAEQCIYLHEHMTVPEYIDAALTAANAVQPQAQGEPVEAIRLSDTVEGSHPSFGGGVFATLDAVDIFYAAPKALAPLTDEQIYNVFASTVEDAEPFAELVGDPIWAEVVEITRAIEAAHGIHAKGGQHEDA